MSIFHARWYAVYLLVLGLWLFALVLRQDYPAWLATVGVGGAIGNLAFGLHALFVPVLKFDGETFQLSRPFGLAWKSWPVEVAMIESTVEREKTIFFRPDGGLQEMYFSSKSILYRRDQVEALIAALESIAPNVSPVSMTGKPG